MENYIGSMTCPLLSTEVELAFGIDTVKCTVIMTDLHSYPSTVIVTGTGVMSFAAVVIARRSLIASAIGNGIKMV